MLYNANITDDEFTVIRPPIGDPSFQDDEYWILKKTIYGLRRSTHNWYNTMKGIILNMGLKDSPHYPRLLSDVISNPSYPETISEAQSQVHVGLYVDDFMFYSSYPTHEALFKTSLQEHTQVNFMVYFDYFLGAVFTWIKHKDGNISVHIFQ